MVVRAQRVRPEVFVSAERVEAEAEDRTPVLAVQVVLGVLPAAAVAAGVAELRPEEMAVSAERVNVECGGDDRRRPNR